MSPLQICRTVEILESYLDSREDVDCSSPFVWPVIEEMVALWVK